MRRLFNEETFKTNCNMKRIYIVMLFAALATITYAQTDDKGYQRELGY